MTARPTRHRRRGVRNQLRVVAAFTLLAAIGEARAAEVLRLDFENSGNLAADTSGNGLVGTIEQTDGHFAGTLTQSTDTRPGSPGSGSANFSTGFDAFDGNSIDFVGAQFPDFGPDDSFTVTLWVKPTQAYVEDSNGLRGIVAAQSEIIEVFEWQFDNGVGEGGVETLSRVGGKVNEPFTDGNLSFNDWQQIGLSYIGPARIAVVFYDEAVTTAKKIDGLSNEDFRVGANLFGARAYDGLMDDLLFTDTAVIYDDSGTQRIAGDLNFDGSIDAGDWVQFKASHRADLSALSAVAAYQAGDIDFDGDNDLDDFLAFKAIYNDVFGPSALEQLIAGVPEPSSLGIVAASLCGLAFRRRRRRWVVGLRTPGRPITVSRPAAIAVAALAATLAVAPADAQSTVFRADFETTDLSLFDNDTNPMFDVDVGSISFAKGVIIDDPGGDSDGERVGAPQLYDLNSDIGAGGTGGFLAGHTDWGDQSLAIDRNSDLNTFDGANMEWVFTDPVALAGAQVDFEFMMLRAGTGPQKNQTITGFDSTGRELFSLLMISRQNFSNSANPDYAIPGVTTGNERQDKTVGYVSPQGGDSLFTSAQIAVGQVPDTNGNDPGNGDQIGFYGSTPATINNTNPNNVFEIDDTALFSLSLTATGWTLDAQAAPTPDNEVSGLMDFTTTEISFSDPLAINLASIEVQTATDQGGGWWDNLEVTGTIVEEPEPLKLIVDPSGSMTLANDGNIPIEIDYVEISSADTEEDGGSLDPLGFAGIGSDADYPAGSNDGLGWEVGVNNTDLLLTDLFLTGSSTFNVGDDAVLGAGFVVGGTEDLQFAYHIVGTDGLTVGVVEYDSMGLLGDADGDGDVDGDDLIAVQTNFGSVTPPPGDADGDGDVDGDDLIAVQTNFGNTASVAVPEPGSLLMLSVAALVYYRRRRKA